VKFGLPEVKRGLFPYQVMASLLQVMPERKVLDWCIQGYNLDAQKAADWGLVTHLAERGKVADAVQELLVTILTNSPTAIRMGLEAYQHIRSDNTKEQHSYLRGMLMKTVQTKDAQEGIMAFREKRKPEWSNE
jgi:enoyl-CoA hydratase/carnithine racemase